MAHEVSARLHTKVVAHKYLEIEVKTSENGKPSKLGTLLISKGNIAEDLDRALKLGLGYPQGPIDLLKESGLEHHHDVCCALSEMLVDPGFRPARQAQVAAARRDAAGKESS